MSSRTHAELMERLEAECADLRRHLDVGGYVARTEAFIRQRDDALARAEAAERELRDSRLAQDTAASMVNQLTHRAIDADRELERLGRDYDVAREAGNDARMMLGGVERERDAAIDREAKSAGHHLARINELSDRADAWRDRFRALVGEDEPDSAGNAVITLKARAEAAEQARDRLAAALATKDAALDEAIGAIRELAERMPWPQKDEFSVVGRAERTLVRLRSAREGAVSKQELAGHVRAAVEDQLPEDEPDDVRRWVYETAVRVMAERLRAAREGQ